MTLDDIKNKNLENIAKINRGVVNMICQTCQINYSKAKQQVVKLKNHYCSKACYLIAVENYSGVCLHCKNEFTVKKHKKRNYKFCSVKCREDYNLKLKEPNCVCLHCNKSFYKLKNHLEKSTNHFCSRNCHAEYRRTRKVKRQKLKDDSLLFLPKKEINCTNCGNIFKKRQIDIKRHNSHFCSKDCRVEYAKNSKNVTTCDTCGKEIFRNKTQIELNKNHFCSNACHNLFMRKPNKITKISPIDDINWRISVFNRDNSLYQECGSTKRLNAHHIRKKKENPLLRLDIDNGITLCNDCHVKTYHKEHLFCEKYEKIIQLKKLLNVLENYKYIVGNI